MTQNVVAQAIQNSSISLGICRIAPQTENARFAQAAKDFGQTQKPQKVRVYEKLRPGIWSDKGLFDLVDFAYAVHNGRKVFRFTMRLSPEPEEPTEMVANLPTSRIIPSRVKQVVFKRDKGKCVLCGADDQLHFDHELPFSRGGASVLPQNIRLLCARHNLEKSAKIE